MDTSLRFVCRRVLVDADQKEGGNKLVIKRRSICTNDFKILVLAGTTSIDRRLEIRIKVSVEFFRAG